MKSQMPASTLPELLVTMIAAAIVILALFDGAELISRINLKLTTLLARNTATAEACNRLEHLFYNSDSIKPMSGLWILYRGGERFAQISYTDSVLEVSISDLQHDTLFADIESVRAVVNIWNPDLTDSLKIRLIGHRGDIGFGVRPRHDFSLYHRLSELERSYYE